MAIFTDRVLVIDPYTDDVDTAESAKVALPAACLGGGVSWGEPQIVTGNLVRHLYESVSAESYGEGSYTITRADYDAACALMA